MRELFLLDPHIVFLNHGSFGACPRPVFEVYQEWQRTLERQPVDFMSRRFAERLSAAREQLAAYLKVSAGEVVFHTERHHRHQYCGAFAAVEAGRRSAGN